MSLALVSFCILLFEAPTISSVPSVLTTLSVSFDCFDSVTCTTIEFVSFYYFSPSFSCVLAFFIFY